MNNKRLRDLGIKIGNLPTGSLNAITDVPGVLVGHSTIIQDEPHIVRTGVTVIVPRQGAIWNNPATAGFHSFNGNGELTGNLWIEESGMLGSCIALTNTNSVGLVRDVLSAYGLQHSIDNFLLPVVAETYDGWLNDPSKFNVTKSDVEQALATARGGEVAEGNVGGGTGMICHEFKGGIGTASRLVNTPSGNYTVGVLVQTNYGDRWSLRLNGIPVGQEINATEVPIPWEKPPKGGSIIVIIGTDAPLLPIQCKRLAKRATIGLGRTGGFGHNSSGDLFLAFSTGNNFSNKSEQLYQLKMLPHEQMDLLFLAVTEAVEESILNALTAANTMTGFKNRTAYALPLEKLQKVIAKYHLYS